MAAFDTTRPAAGLSVGSMIARAIAAIVAWNDARVTRRELSKLTARELDDIGLTAGDIDMVATRITR